MKKRIDRNASANTDSYYNIQQIVKALDSHASNQGLKYLIDKNQQATQLLQSGQNHMFIDEAAGILFREYCGTYLNKSVSSISVDCATNSMHFIKPPVEYSTTTHDLKLAFIQTPENRGKITEYTAALSRRNKCPALCSCRE